MIQRDSEVFRLFSEDYRNYSQEEMSLQEYLLACREDKSMYASAAERMVDAIGAPKLLDTSRNERLGRIFANRTIKIYPAFADFFGMEDTIERIAGYFRYASPGLEERKQILYLLGPVGIDRGTEARTDPAGARPLQRARGDAGRPRRLRSARRRARRGPAASGRQSAQRDARPQRPHRVDGFRRGPRAGTAGRDGDCRSRGHAALHGAGASSPAANVPALRCLRRRRPALSAGDGQGADHRALPRGSAARPRVGPGAPPARRTIGSAGRVRADRRAGAVARSEEALRERRRVRDGAHRTPDRHQ